MHELSKKKVIALTGSMGSGKSQATNYISKFYPVTDCDKINAQLLIKGQEGYNELVQLDWIQLDEQGEIDKKSMAFSMFSDIEKKKRVELILHPLIFKKIDEWVSKQTSSIVFVEVPILFEINAESRFDEVWCIYCDLDIALERLMAYRNFTKEEALARLQSQLDPEIKISKSDVVIQNNGSLEELERNIDQYLERS